MLVGDVMSATVPRAKVNPVIAPQVLRLTSAVACRHVGFFTECTESPPSPLQVCVPGPESMSLLARVRHGLEDGLYPRVTRVVGVLEQHAHVLRGHRGGADYPLLVDVGHERGLAFPAGHRAGAQAREPGVRDHG